MNYETSGGGFMNSTQNREENSFGTNSNANDGNAKKYNKRDNQCITPLTILQCTSKVVYGDDDVFRIDEIELNQVKVLGMIMSISRKSTMIQLTINDGTDSIEVNQYLHGEDDEGNSQVNDDLVEGGYVVVYGLMRSFQGKLNISAHGISSMENNFNHLTYHFLECIGVHLKNTRGAIGTGMNTPSKAKMGNSMNTPTHAFSGLGVRTPNNGRMEDTDSEFTPGQSRVLNVVGACTSDTGVSFQAVSSTLQGQMNENDIQYVTFEFCFD